MMAVGSTSIAQPAAVADYPTRVLKFIVPLGAGGTADVIARFYAERMSIILGQPVVVENATGAGGIIAAMNVKRAPADGYTILMGTAGMISANPIFVQNLDYDPVKDFTPVAGLMRGMTVVIVPASSNIKSVADLVQNAKRAREPLNCGTVSQVYQVVQEWLASLASVKFSNVPYKLGTALLTDIASGQVDMAVTDLASSVPMIKDGRVRAIAVTGEARHPDLPDVPTMRESGYPELVNYSWISMFVRTGTPDPIVAKLAKAVASIQETPKAKELAAGIKSALMAGGPAELRKHQLDEIERFRLIAKTAGIRPQ